MKINKMTAVTFAFMVMGIIFSGCGRTSQPVKESAVTEAAAAVQEAVEPTEKQPEQIETTLEKVDMTKWQYATEDDVYWQVGMAYCENPKDAARETMGFYVPGKYFNAADNGDGTFTCTLNYEGNVGGYTAQSAPIIIPVNTPGYMAMSAPTGYGAIGYGVIGDYTSAGFILAVPGARGRESGAPAGVTDFKAAIRYIRYNANMLPGSMNAIFTEGMSGGGAQSAVIGATGDSPLYDPYLEEIGAIPNISDAVMGSMCWCPITNLDEADAAYEWNLGVSRSDLTEDEQRVSDALAESYADYINKLCLKDEDGNSLLLEDSESGIAQAGTYYDRILMEIELSLNHFLEDTVFPYTPSSGRGPGGMMGPGGPGGMMGGGGPGMGDHIGRTNSSGGVNLSGTYETAEDYIAALNANGTWVVYDAGTNTAKISDVASFVKALKQASKRLGAFDQMDGRQGENTLFGYDGKGAHFDKTLYSIVSSLKLEEEASFAQDFSRVDAVGNTVETRVNMYTPLYYLLASQEGYHSSQVAPFWRIRTGINQGDTALCTEVNLALALEAYDAVRDVDFAMVWGQGHTTAERSGDPVANFIDWVNACMQDGR